MSDRALVNCLLIAIALIVATWGYKTTEYVASIRVHEAALAQCRKAGSVTVVAEAAAGWDDALKVAERCVADLDYCRSLCAPGGK